ncbi:FAD-dependent oxidoreductase [Hanstruepera ponticola]|uniref:FAD-dependent oxidoreductase n=1 Tax=Hanstruepera ponticola TaxID=2042995 RepID=UPI00177EC0B2|nr:FAD-dependent oxidoreductase [Hanstruepera ponticola]
MYDALIIGGGAAGLSCALVLGSAGQKDFTKDKITGIITHQKASHLQSALFNNVLGLNPGTTGKSILENGKNQLAELYPRIEQIDNEKVTAVMSKNDYFIITTNKAIYQTKIAVIAVGYTNLFNIHGLESYIKPHPRAKAEKNRIWLENTDHLVRKGLYVAGTLAGWRSQFAIACGSGSHVATDILTLWNNGEHTKVHDKL